MAQSVEVLVDGGKASAGPPLGPALGPLGVNVMAVVQAINEKTKDFAGMKVPVKVTVEPKKKTFEISVGTPPTTQLIMTELGLRKGSGTPNTAKVGNLTVVQAAKIARMKEDALTGATLAKRVKEVIGCCVSMGITVEGKDARVTQADIERGMYADALKD